MRPTIAFCTMALAGALYGCESGTPTTQQDAGVIRAEAACDVAGLPAPLRQTVILIDAKAIQKADNGDQFAQVDGPLRDLILSIADPIKALASGAAAPRERVVLAVVPVDGSAAELAFTGCIPGLSPQELTHASHDRSITDEVFSAGASSKVQADGDAFRTQLIGGMIAIARRAVGAPSPQRGSVADAPYLRGARDSKTLFDTKGVTRIVLMSDLSGLAIPDDSDPGKAFDAGVETGRKASGDYGRAELHLVLPVGRSIAGREFLRGYFLAQDAQLASIAAGRIGSSPPPPLRLWRFAGQAFYPSGPQIADIRIGDDGHGKLSSSWLSLLENPRFAIPITGQIVCAISDGCKIASDNAGFAQVWTGGSAGAPRFNNDLPFGGMRQFAFDIVGPKLEGRAYDEGVALRGDEHRNAIAIKATAKQGGN